MSRKNRAFALAVATAALAGLSAPVAGAATLQGPSGFNNDSILDLSGNQLPIAACNLGIPVDVLLAQIPLTGLGLVGDGILNSNTSNPANNQTCSQTPTETNTSTDVSTPADNGTSGFNGDSVLNASGNQIPVAICNFAAPLTETGFQVPITFIGAVLGSGALNSNTQSPTNTQSCTQKPGHNNSTTFNTNSNNGNNG
jgi:hypothetical protein